jgi:kexin
MRFSTAWIQFLQLASLVSSAASQNRRPRNYSTREYYALELSAGANPTDWAVHLGLEYEEPIGALDNHFLFSGLKRDIDVVAVLRRRMKSKKDVEFSNQVLFHQKQVTKGLVRRAPPLEKRQFGVNMPQASNPELVQRQDFIRKNLTIDDPMFREQWHLVNSR